MIRIATEEGPYGRIVRVEGHLKREDVAVLEEVCSHVARPYELDLKELRGIDEAGAIAIRRLTAGGARVAGASAYVRLRLATDCHADSNGSGGNSQER